MSKLKRLLKWSLLLGGVLMLLSVIFLILPGFTCYWRFPESGKAWIVLRRTSDAWADGRVVTVGPAEMYLTIVQPHIPANSLPRGFGWGNGRIIYVADRLIFGAGLRQ